MKMKNLVNQDSKFTAFLAVKALSNSFGIGITSLSSCGTLTYRYSDEKKDHHAKIYDTRKGRSYFIAGKSRQYIDDFIRVDFGM